MLNEEMLKQVIAAVLEVDPSSIDDDTSTDTMPNWDSLRHMNLVLALEQEFQVQISDEDAYSIKSYQLIKLVLKELLAYSAKTR